MGPPQRRGDDLGARHRQGRAASTASRATPRLVTGTTPSTPAEPADRCCCTAPAADRTAAPDRQRGGAATPRTKLREGYDADAVADVLWSVGSPMVYRKTVTERGWSPERYERWLADLLRRLFLPDAL